MFFTVVSRVIMYFIITIKVLTHFCRHFLDQTRNDNAWCRALSTISVFVSRDPACTGINSFSVFCFVYARYTSISIRLGLISVLLHQFSCWVWYGLHFHLYTSFSICFCDIEWSWWDLGWSGLERCLLSSIDLWTIDTEGNRIIYRFNELL